MNFVLSIREDAWAKLDRFEGRIPRLFANYVRVEHLDRDAAREAIEGPIARVEPPAAPGRAAVRGRARARRGGGRRGRGRPARARADGDGVDAARRGARRDRGAVPPARDGAALARDRRRRLARR